MLGGVLGCTDRAAAARSATDYLLEGRGPPIIDRGLMGGPSEVIPGPFGPLGGSAARWSSTYTYLGPTIGESIYRRGGMLNFAKLPRERAPRDRREALRGTFRHFSPKSAGARPYFGTRSAERQKGGPHRSEDI